MRDRVVERVVRQLFTRPKDFLGIIGDVFDQSGLFALIEAAKVAIWRLWPTTSPMKSLEQSAEDLFEHYQGVAKEDWPQPCSCGETCEEAQN